MVAIDESGILAASAAIRGGPLSKLGQSEPVAGEDTRCFFSGSSAIRFRNLSKNLGSDLTATLLPVNERLWGLRRSAVTSAVRMVKIPALRTI